MYKVFEELLQKFGIKASEVSKATGIGASTLSDWKRGRCTPKADKLQRIADYFGVSLEYLMNGEEGLRRLKFSMDKFDLLTKGLETIGWEMKYVDASGNELEYIDDDETEVHTILTNGRTSFEVSNDDINTMKNDATDFFAKRVRTLMLKTADEIVPNKE